MDKDYLALSITWKDARRFLKSTTLSSLLDCAVRGDLFLPYGVISASVGGPTEDCSIFTSLRGLPFSLIPCEPHLAGQDCQAVVVSERASTASDRLRLALQEREYYHPWLLSRSEGATPADPYSPRMQGSWRGI